MECSTTIGVVFAEIGDAGTLVSLLVGAFGAASGALGTYLARRYRIKSDTALTEQQRLFAQYRRLVDELQEQVTRLRGEVMDVQTRYLECFAENTTLKARIADLEMQIVQIKGSPADGTRADPGLAGRGQPDDGPVP
jgi:septal ring factor EnvC (AmiA/AmiB activator)